MTGESWCRAGVTRRLWLQASSTWADAVGTQTEAVLIRGLSVGVSVRRVVRRELLTGAVVGVVMGAAFFAFALAVWGDSQVAGAVGIALSVSCAIATVIAITLPWAFAPWGRPSVRLRPARHRRPGPALDRGLPALRHGSRAVTSWGASLTVARGIGLLLERSASATTAAAP